MTAAPGGAAAGDFVAPPPAASLTEGLDPAEVAARQRQFGYNEITVQRRSALLAFAGKFWAPVPWMLEAASILTLLLGRDVDAVVILFLLVFNAMVSFAQEGRAQKALELLKARLEVRARVLRSGSWQTVGARELVPGDVVHLRMGDVVPADLAIATGSVLMDESALTGEAVPVEKGPHATAYAAAVVQRGEATGWITATAAHTYFGKTTELVNLAHTQSHLERTILGIVRYLLILDVVLVAALVVFSFFVHVPWDLTLPFAVIVLVGSVPVALPATFTLAQALGAQELALKGVLVTRLSAIEEAASMDVLCTDKTGTLTENRLRVAAVVPVAPFSEAQVLQCAGAASDDATQDPIDLAILQAARERGVPPLDRLDFTPFDPATKRTAARVDHGGQAWEIIKGAPQVVAQACVANASALTGSVAGLAAHGYRVLAVAAGEAGRLDPVGLVALEDPPRPDSAALIQALRDLGVSTKMVTGDAPETAAAVAEALHIGSRMLRGGPAAASPRDRRDDGDDYDVFAGVFPQDKYDLVQHLQRRGHVVGMTGDGVNDAPALRQAEVGIAVASATDVAKAAASLVLTTPGLTNIVAAVESSRRIYQRMQTYTLNKIIKTVQLALFLTLGFFLTRQFVTTPRLVVMLLFANDFVTMAISTDRVTPGPKPARWDVRRLVTSSLAMGLIMLIEAFVVLAVGRDLLHAGWSQVHSLVFVMLVFSGLATVFVVREPGWFWRSRPSRALILASLGDVGAVALFARVGVLMTAVAWSQIIWVALIAVGFMFVLDAFKAVALRPQPAG